MGKIGVFQAKAHLSELLDQVERQIIINTLELTGGDKEKAAEILQISRASIYNKINKHKIAEHL